MNKELTKQHMDEIWDRLQEQIDNINEILACVNVRELREDILLARVHLTKAQETAHFQGMS